MAEPDLESDIQSLDELEAESVVSSVGRVTKFPSHATATLESLYSHGMTGWGKDHEEEIRAAIEGTGLKLKQIQVCWYLLAIRNYVSSLVLSPC